MTQRDWLWPLSRTLRHCSALDDGYEDGRGARLNIEHCARSRRGMCWNLEMARPLRVNIPDDGLGEVAPAEACAPLHGHDAGNPPRTLAARRS